MGNRMIVTAILVVCVVLGTGLWATARQVTGQSNIVDPSMEQAKDIYISASDEAAMPEKPVIASHYGAEQATTVHPILRWSRIDGAVMYDVQVLEKHVADGTETETYDMIMPMKRAYTNACELALPENFTADHFYWRVRGLALDGHAVSAYSDLEETYVDHLKPVLEKPTTLSVYNQGRGQVLLYPVYDWIAVPEAASYELEIMDEAPENPNGIEPSIHRIEAYYPQYAEQYDAKSHVSDSPFYWRVRALDKDGHPLGVYSDASSFVTDPSVSYAAAIFGDSISHGGGSISYSPTDWDFSYGSYLDFPTINLSQSGDTSEMTAKRFDQDVLPFHPAYLLILMGSNSIRAGVPASDVIADMEYVRKQCLEHGIKPVFLTMPPFNADNIKKAFNEPTAYGWSRQVQLVNEYIRSHVHIDITENMEDENGDLRTELALDGLHLDPPGKRMMAEAINKAWPDIIALPDSAWKQ
ncbi:MAG: GDSL-type esterase/lipase family protein [Megasphaera sp.]|nr:GDSL-type esterase/lipase family protein [Megasphaera sp.]MCH4188684.1 GDSL-type esterase/lipase family protein [Megasphaera sp.]MCH4218552.1 GDSL-type esterase/lipase family protein [Megasphaera sp.]